MALATWEIGKCHQDVTRCQEMSPGTGFCWHQWPGDVMTVTCYSAPQVGNFGPRKTPHAVAEFLRCVGAAAVHILSVSFSDIAHIYIYRKCLIILYFKYLEPKWPPSFGWLTLSLMGQNLENNGHGHLASRHIIMIIKYYNLNMCKKILRDSIWLPWPFQSRCSIWNWGPIWPNPPILSHFQNRFPEPMDHHGPTTEATIPRCFETWPSSFAILEPERSASSKRCPP